jgi:hypothetical protein
VSKRKMLAAEEDIANKVAELANKRGLTVYQTVNDILEQALRAEESGLNLKEAVDRSDSMKRARDLGLAFTVEHLYYQVVDAAYKNGKEQIIDLYRDMGIWYGKYFKTRNHEPIKAFHDALGFITYGSQFSVEKGRGDEYSVNCISERFSRGYTEAFSTFLEAAYSVLGFRVVDREVTKGIIRLKLEKSR